MGSEILQGFEQHTIRNRDAEITYWLRHGQQDRWVIFLHGACADHDTFKAQIPAFDDRYSLLLLDQRGSGQSPLLNGKRIDFLDMVDDVLKICERHGIVNASLLAHSHGAFVAQEFAFLHPARVKRLILSGCYDQHKESYPNSFAEYVRKVAVYALLLLPWSVMANLSARVSSDNPASRADIRRWLLLAGRQKFWDLGRSAQARAHYVESYEHPHPTLLINGTLDYPKVLSVICDDMVRRNPLCRQVWLPEVGHMCHQDAPEAFNAHMMSGLSDG